MSDKIKPLEEHSIINENGDCCGMYQPSTLEIMFKINEIIERLNDEEIKNEQKHP